MTYQDQMRKGTTAVILLHLLAELGRPVHGYEVIKELQRRSEGGFDFKEGLVYPRLHELERQGYLRSYWQESGEGTPPQVLRDHRPGAPAAGRGAAGVARLSQQRGRPVGPG